MVINFNPSLVVNYATENVSLVRNVILNYTISSGEILSIDGPLGAVIIEDAIEVVEVRTNKSYMSSCTAVSVYCCKAGAISLLDLL